MVVAAYECDWVTATRGVFGWAFVSRLLCSGKVGERGQPDACFLCMATKPVERFVKVLIACANRTNNIIQQLQPESYVHDTCRLMALTCPTLLLAGIWVTAIGQLECRLFTVK